MTCLRWQIVLVLMALASQAQAGGLMVQELANPRNGTAQAGQAAYAYDAATALYNPAGMARMKEPKLMLGLQPMWLDVEFDSSSNTTFSGGNGGNQGGLVPGLGTFYVRPLNDRWALGGSIAAIAGGALSPDGGWVGRSYLTELSLFAIGVNPVVSYRVNDWLSVGGGVSLNYANMDMELKLLRLVDLVEEGAVRGRLAPIAQAALAERLKQAAGNLPPGLGTIIGKLPPRLQKKLRDAVVDRLSSRAQAALQPYLADIARAKDFLESGPEGEVELDGVDDFALSWNLAILIEPNERTRFGVTYRSKIDFEMDGDFDVNNAPPLYRALGIRDGDVGADIPIPQTVRASLYHQLTDTIAVMGDVGWEDWSVMDFTPITGPSGALVEIPRRWHDTWHFGLGTEWRAAPRWLLQTGVGFDTSPVRDRRHNLPDMPSGNQWRFSAGFVYDWSDSVTVGLNYTYIDFGRSPIDARTPIGRLEGDYKDFQAHAVSLSVQF